MNNLVIAWNNLFQPHRWSCCWRIVYCFRIGKSIQRSLKMVIFDFTLFKQCFNAIFSCKNQGFEFMQLDIRNKTVAWALLSFINICFH